MDIEVKPRVPRAAAPSYDPAQKRQEHIIYQDGEAIACSWSRAAAKAAARIVYLRGQEFARAHTITVRTKRGKLVMDYPSFTFEGRTPEEIVPVGRDLVDGAYHDERRR